MLRPPEGDQTAFFRDSCTYTVHFERLSPRNAPGSIIGGELFEWRDQRRTFSSKLSIDCCAAGISAGSRRRQRRQ
jgi:hypothetical protein